MRRFFALVALLALFSAGVAAENVLDRPPTGESPATEQVAPPERISLDFPNEEITVILRAVADMFALNLVVPEDLKGRRSSIKLRNVTWRQIFREILTPIGYTFLEDDNIIRVVSHEALVESQRTLDETGPEFTDDEASDFPAWFTWSIAAVALIHLILSVGVLRDRLPGAARFAPKFVWAFAVLLGGLVPLAIYWLIHHSTLARTANYDQPPVLS